MASALDSLVIVGPQYQEVFSDDLLVTPTGGTQGRLADKLGMGAGTTLRATAVTSNATGALGTLPANAFPLYALLRETAGHGVTLGIGTSSGASDVATGLVVPASGTLTVPITSFILAWFSATATQALFLSSASWGGASINATLVYQIGP